MKLLLIFFGTLAMSVVEGYVSICDEKSDDNSDFTVLFEDTFDGEQLSKDWVITEGNELGQVRSEEAAKMSPKLHQKSAAYLPAFI